MQIIRQEFNNLFFLHYRELHNAKKTNYSLDKYPIGVYNLFEKQ